MKKQQKMYALAALAAAAALGCVLVVNRFIFPSEDERMQASSGAKSNAAGAAALHGSLSQEGSDKAEETSPSTAARGSEQVRILREDYAEFLTGQRGEVTPAQEQLNDTKAPATGNNTEKEASESQSQPDFEEIGTTPETSQVDSGIASDRLLPGPAPAENSLNNRPRLWLPAAMLEPDDSIGISTEMQVAAWEELQNNFVEAVNGQVPNEEAAKTAWIKAQQENDDLFRLKFGWDAFNAQQLKAYREGLAPQQP